ncbi:hypothetical protein CAMRE0001_1669 [Campylobacter rectus RM3267]|uniref:Uncharacterized protein n=1 Tax=Campylobacter rectus RM3267 TaxID=553218 RepID=B9CZ88_CAMRE|nr:hypothetical protein CAMRE0001_1669 [Campylobacter rectus RM3267]
MQKPANLYPNALFILIRNRNSAKFRLKFRPNRLIGRNRASTKFLPLFCASFIVSAARIGLLG